MFITGEPAKHKNDLLKGIEPGFISSKIISRNTLKATYPGGKIIIYYWSTPVITINPDGSTVLKSGGYLTKTTKRRIEENTDIMINQINSIWYVLTNRSIPGKRDKSMFYDGITINRKGKITSGIRVPPVKEITRFKKDVGKLVNLITVENLPVPDDGDCLICRFDFVRKKATADHLLSHVQEQYIHGSLIVLALELNGFKPGYFYQFKAIKNIRRAVRKLIIETCIPAIMENPGIYSGINKEDQSLNNPVMEGF